MLRDMKKLLLCLLLFCCCLQVFSFGASRGFRFGTTVSRLVGNDWEFTKDFWEQELEISLSVPVSNGDYFGWGWSVGVFYELSLFRFLAIQPELFYTTYHGGVKLQNDTLSHDWVKLGTIYRVAEAPLIVKIRLSQKLAVFSGPLVMFRFLPPKDIIISSDDRDSDPVLDDSVFSRWAYGVVGGIEYRIDDEVLIDIRYNYNLTSFDDFGSSWENDTIFQSAIATVGFIF
jgi:hypothetical protein